MARKRHGIAKTWVAAARDGVAATLLLTGLAMPASGDPGLDWSAREILPAELRVALGDLERLGDNTLPPRHVEGLTARIEGALGLLPWLLLKAGDEAGAGALTAWAERPFETATDRAALTDLLQSLAEDHPLALAERLTISPPAADLAEAAAIHEAYCMGCHDGFGDGDPDTRLPGRDLRLMARDEPGEVFLSRLVNGVKGDASIAFVNPLTERQVMALMAYYRSTDVPDEE